MKWLARATTTRKDGISANMLRITAKINIGENGGTLNTVTSSQSGINVSSTFNEVIGHHEQIQRPFILGRSRLGGGDRFTKKANFYIGRIASDSNGNFSSNYVIDVSGENITQLTIVFNKRDKQFPKSILVDGEAFYDDDANWTIKLDSANTHTITISNWNKPNSPFVITSIYTDLSINIDESNLLDFERTISDRSSTNAPSFGIISNSGSMSFIDKDGEVLDLIAQQLLSNKNIISVYLKNTKTNAQEQIAYFNTQKWSYSNSLSVVDVQLKDDLEEWQNINVPAINYVPNVSTSQTAKWLYNYLHSKTPAKYRMLSFDELDEKTKSVLNSTTILYPFLESGSLWAEWDKLCQLCFLHIYKENSGITVCRVENELWQ